MSSKELGNNFSQIEVTNISKNGFWLLTAGGELFLPFEKFPWFKKATLEHVMDVKEVSKEHFYWEALDIDLTSEIIQNPDNFPNIANSRQTMLEAIDKFSDDFVLVRGD
ncbi:MAG TPA: DUF2442 domain-containing protein [Campylobacterales bacterium]|nr:DUF2442 domain-containing protein [Campylobacterales bacterium]